MTCKLKHDQDHAEYFLEMQFEADLTFSLIVLLTILSVGEETCIIAFSPHAGGQVSSRPDELARRHV